MVSTTLPPAFLTLCGAIQTVLSVIGAHLECVRKKTHHLEAEKMGKMNFHPIL